MGYKVVENIREIADSYFPFMHEDANYFSNCVTSRTAPREAEVVMAA